MAIQKVPIVLDKPRTLLYDVNALIELGEELNLNLMSKEGWEELVGKFETPAPKTMDDKPEPVFVAAPSFRKVRAIIWAGLRHEDEALTIRQVGAMLDPTNLQPVIEAYIKAFVASEATEGASPNAPAPALAAASGPEKAVSAG